MEAFVPSENGAELVTSSFTLTPISVIKRFKLSARIHNGGKQPFNRCVRCDFVPLTATFAPLLMNHKGALRVSTNLQKSKILLKARKYLLVCWRSCFLCYRQTGFTLEKVTFPHQLMGEIVWRIMSGNGQQPCSASSNNPQLIALFPASSWSDVNRCVTFNGSHCIPSI